MRLCYRVTVFAHIKAIFGNVLSSVFRTFFVRRSVVYPKVGIKLQNNVLLALPNTKIFTSIFQTVIGSLHFRIEGNEKGGCSPGKATRRSSQPPQMYSQVPADLLVSCRS